MVAGGRTSGDSDRLTSTAATAGQEGHGRTQTTTGRGKVVRSTVSAVAAPSNLVGLLQLQPVKNKKVERICMVITHLGSREVRTSSNKAQGLEMLQANVFPSLH
ncbi:uncharacterized protein [Lolium perenne]|uniref:uncharacterized protein n=1 Tax=Lolium perenne TaxID=4522 RepID=UPI003A994DE7